MWNVANIYAVYSHEGTCSTKKKYAEISFWNICRLWYRFYQNMECAQLTVIPFWNICPPNALVDINKDWAWISNLVSIFFFLFPFFLSFSIPHFHLSFCLTRILPELCTNGEMKANSQEENQNLYTSQFCIGLAEITRKEKQENS